MGLAVQEGDKSNEWTINATLIKKWKEANRREICAEQMPALICSLQEIVNAIHPQECNAVKESHIFGVGECAKKLGCSSQKVRDFTRKGLQHIWMGKNLKFTDDFIDQFLASRTLCASVSLKSTTKGGNQKTFSKSKRVERKQVSRTSIKERMSAWD